MSSAPTPVPASRTAEPVARPGKPVTVALIGLPGAGKSLVARALADQLDYRRVDRDTIRHAMFPRCSYSFVEKRASFRGVLLALEVNCMLGESSVIDGCTFSRRADLARVDQVIRQYSYTAIPIFLDCPSDLARERIARDVAENRHLARDRNPDVVGEVLARMEPPPPGALTIDARLPAAEVCRLAVEAVAGIAGIAL
jgi:predicted kinase